MALGRSSTSASRPWIIASRESAASSWMKMCTVPPHISPTVPARSSEMPYVTIRAGAWDSNMAIASWATALSTQPPVTLPSIVASL